MNSGKTAKLPCIVDRYDKISSLWKTNKMPICRLEGFVLLWKKNDHIISVGQQLLDKVNIQFIDDCNPMLIFIISEQHQIQNRASKQWELFDDILNRGC